MAELGCAGEVTVVFISFMWVKKAERVTRTYKRHHFRIPGLLDTGAAAVTAAAAPAPAAGPWWLFAAIHAGRRSRIGVVKV